MATEWASWTSSNLHRTEVKLIYLLCGLRKVMRFLRKFVRFLRKCLRVCGNVCGFAEMYADLLKSMRFCDLCAVVAEIVAGVAVYDFSLQSVVF